MMLDEEDLMLPTSHSIRLAQEIVRKYVPRDRNLVDELLGERRQEKLAERRRSGGLAS